MSKEMKITCGCGNVMVQPVVVLSGSHRDFYYNPTVHCTCGLVAVVQFRSVGPHNPDPIVPKSDCPKCGGNGEFDHKPFSDSPQTVKMKCPTCKGSGSQSDIVDGKATRDIKADETISISLEEYMKLPPRSISDL